MKKLLLLLCAFVASVSGAWGQTNLASGKSVVIDNTATGNTYSDAQRLLITNGMKSNSEDPNINLKLTKAGDNNVIDWFYIDFGVSKTPKTIAITWTNCRPTSYEIYLSAVVPTIENKGTKVFTKESAPDGGAVTTYHTLTGDVSGQYISLVPAQSSVNGWGCILSEIEVYEAYTPALTTLTASCGNTSLTIGDNATITVSGADQIGLPIATGDLTWESTNDEIISVYDGTVTANAVGTGNIKAKSGVLESNAITFTVFASVTEPTTPTIADENIKIIYIGDDSKSTTGLTKYRVSDYQPDGWLRKALKYDSGINVELVMASNDVSDMTYMHLDIYPLEATTLALFVNGPGLDWNGYDINSGNEIPAGAWFSVDIPVSFFTETCSHPMNTLTNIVFCNNVANTSAHTGFANFGSPYKSFIIGNVYFWKEATSYSMTATAGVTTLSKGETTNITTTVTDTDASDVTASSAISYTSDNTDVVTVTSDGIVTAKGLGSATVTVSVIYDEIEKTKTIDFTVNLPVAIEPTADAALVDAVFSAKYDRTTIVSGKDWGLGGSGISSLYEDYSAETVSGHTYIHVTNGTGFGSRPASVLTLNYTTAYVALYPIHATNGKMFADNLYTSGVEFNLTPGQWNYISVSLPNTENYVAVELYSMDGGTKTPETEFYLDHFYFKRLADGEVAVLSPDANGISKVVGTINETNKTTVESSTANVIDISNATLAAGITTISLATNQLLVVNCSSQGAQLTSNTTNVVAKGEYYYSYQPIEIIDDNAHQPNTHISINTYKTGYSIQRTIGAGKYVTTYLPIAVAQVNIPTGLTVYQLDGSSTTAEVKFNKVTGDIAGATPYVLHNSTEGDLILTATHAANTAGDFNLSGAITPVKNTAESVSFIGNYTVKAGTGSEWGLQNSTAASPEFKTIGTGAKIGAFRAYFTGLATAGARAIFDDLDGTTSIRKIEDILNQDDVYYNLNGQRVLNPTKGIYILNGKKVIVK